MDWFKKDKKEETLNEEQRHEQKGAALIFLCMTIAAIAVLVLCIVLILNTGRGDTPVEAATVTESTSNLVDIEEVEPTEDKTEETEPTEVPSEAPSEPVTDETVTLVNPDDVELLACVIYQEAGGSNVCDDCRRRVADVVLNRVECEYFPDTIYGVLTGKNQYGLFHWTGVVWPGRASHETEAHAVKRAYRIAHEVLSGYHSDLYGKGYIWQAEFPQGINNIYCCGIYFGQIKSWTGE